MITINIVSVGSLKENYLVSACKEYEKRMQPFVKLFMIEVKESMLEQNASEQEIIRAKEKEAEMIKPKIKGFSICLEIEGQTFSSEDFAKKIETLTTSGVSEFTFIIGGSNGLDKSLSNSCNMKLSFSKFTFPHQLMRVILLEQIYRAMCIINNKTYHK